MPEISIAVGTAPASMPALGGASASAEAHLRDRSHGERRASARPSPARPRHVVRLQVSEARPQGADAPALPSLCTGHRDEALSTHRVVTEVFSGARSHPSIDARAGARERARMGIASADGTERRSRSPWTGTGDRRLGPGRVVANLHPKPFQPQQKAAPLTTAHVCESPAETAWTPLDEALAPGSGTPPIHPRTVTELPEHV